MWNLVPRSTQILVVVALGLVSASLAAWLIEVVQHQERPPILFISLAATSISLLIVPLAQILWRPLWRLIPALNRWACPDLNGTWRGEAIPAVGGIDKGEARPATVTIRQGLLDVTVSLVTDQLESHTIRATVELDRAAHKFRIRYAYDGRPPPNLAKVNPRHEGAACLEADLNGKSDVLVGRYFTDRGTNGSLVLKRVTEKSKAQSKTLKLSRPPAAGSSAPRQIEGAHK